MSARDRSDPQHIGYQESATASGFSERLTQLAGKLSAGVQIDLSLAPLVCTGILGRPGPLVEVRHHLEEWVKGTGLPTETVTDVVLATYEALANAAEHAYPSGGGPVDLIAASTVDSRLLVTVRDYGRWRSPCDSGLRGRGLVIIKALAHRAEVRRTPHGTWVHMEWDLPVTGYGSGSAKDE